MPGKGGERGRTFKARLFRRVKFLMIRQFRRIQRGEEEEASEGPGHRRQGHPCATDGCFFVPPPCPNHKGSLSRALLADHLQGNNGTETWREYIDVGKNGRRREREEKQDLHHKT